MPIALPLIALDVLVVVLWTVAAALAIALVMSRVGDVLGGIPGIGGALSSAAKSIAKAITNACGALMHGIEGLVGAGLHLLARYLDKTFQQLVAHASLIAHLAHIVGRELVSVSGIRALVHRLSKAVHVVLHRFVQIGHELDHLRHRVKALEHALVGIGDDVLPQIRSLDRELSKVEHKVIPAIESEVTAVENDVTALRKWIADHVPAIGTQTFVDAVAVALGMLGLGGLRCSSLFGALNRRGCGLWQGLEDLLGLLFDAALFVDLCHLLPELELLFSALEAPLVDLIASAADAACAHPPQGWVELEAPHIAPPAVYYTGPVPGN